MGRQRPAASAATVISRATSPINWIPGDLDGGGWVSTDVTEVGVTSAFLSRCSSSGGVDAAFSGPLASVSRAALAVALETPVGRSVGSFAARKSGRQR